MLRFIDGFDHYNTTADLSLKWTSFVTTIAFGTASSRFGVGNYITVASAGSFTKTIDAQATWIVGFAVKIGTTANGSPIVNLLDAGTVQVRLIVNSDGTLSFQRNTTTLATSTATLSVGVWYFVELKCLINNTTGTYEVRVNGVAVIGPTTGANTRNTANNSANQIKLESPSGASATATAFDDVYVCDGTGTVNNDFLGECRVNTLYTNGAGNYTEWTPSAGSNFQAVDETPENGDTDYVSSSTVNQRDTYAYADLTTGGTIKGVQVNFWARKDDAGVRQIAPLLRISAADFVGSTITLGASYAWAGQVYETNPNTAAAWSSSEVNGAEYGVKLIA